MKRCPKCNTKVGVLRLLLSTRWSPYKCRGCSGKFQRRAIHAALLGGIGGGSGALIVQASRSYHSVWIAITGLIALFAVLIWLDWFLVPLEEAESSERRKPT